MQTQNQISKDEQYRLTRAILMYGLAIVVLLAYRAFPHLVTWIVGVALALVCAVIDRMVYGNLFEKTKWKFWKYKEPKKAKRVKKTWRK